MSVYDRIPKSAYAARVVLGERAHVSLDSVTRLHRIGVNGMIGMRYGLSIAPDLVRWHPDGSVAVYVPQRGPFHMPSLRRIATALPSDWDITDPRRIGGGRMRRPRYLYRGQYELDISRLTFRPNGDVQFGETGSRLTPAMLDAEVSDREGYEPMRSRRRTPRSIGSYVVMADLHPERESPIDVMRRAADRLAWERAIATPDPEPPAAHGAPMGDRLTWLPFEPFTDGHVHVEAVCGCGNPHCECGASMAPTATEYVCTYPTPHGPCGHVHDEPLTSYRNREGFLFGVYRGHTHESGEVIL